MTEAERRKDEATGYQAAVKDIVTWLNEYAEFELIAAIIEAKFGEQQ
jgi:hypothetical protein